MIKHVKSKYTTRKDAKIAMKFMQKENPTWIHTIKGTTLYSIKEIKQKKKKSRGISMPSMKF